MDPYKGNKSLTSHCAMCNDTSVEFSVHDFFFLFSFFCNPRALEAFENFFVTASQHAISLLVQQSVNHTELYKVSLFIGSYMAENANIMHIAYTGHVLCMLF